MTEPILAIDFGASKIVTYVYHRKTRRVELINDSEGSRWMPTCVAFTDEGRLIGPTALYQAENNPENTIFGTNIKKLLCSVINEPNANESNFNVNYKRKSMSMSVEQVIGMLLGEIKKNAQNQIGQKIDSCVISVSSKYSNLSMLDACSIIDLNLLYPINEPTSAAFIYGKEILKAGESKNNLLIFDMGAKTTKLEVVNINKNKKDKIEIKKHYGETDLNLGGEDFVLRLVEYFVGELKKNGIDVTKNKILCLRLKNGCEKLKLILSTQAKATHTIETFHNDQPYRLNMTLQLFERLCEGLFERVNIILTKAMHVQPCDHVIIVGGCVNMPKIKSILTKITKHTPMEILNKDEALAKGAAYSIEVEIENKFGKNSIKKLNKRQITKMREIEQEFSRDEQEQKEVSNLFNELERLCYANKRKGYRTSDCDRVLEWLKKSESTPTKEQLQSKIQELKGKSTMETSTTPNYITRADGRMQLRQERSTECCSIM